MSVNSRSRMVIVAAIAVGALTVSGQAAVAADRAAGWTSRPPLAVARVGAAAATVGGLLVETGGSDTAVGELVAPAETRLRAGSGVWRPAAPVPTPRINAAAATLAGEVWVVGGYGEGDPPVDVVERYDPRADRWTAGPALPEGRAQAGAAVLHDVLYVVGGDLATADGEVVTGSAIAFDPRKRRWTPIAPLPVARDRLRLVAAGDHLYAIGGATADGTSLSTVDRYDPRRNRWTSVAAMRQTRSVPGATAVGGGRIAVVGGCQFVAGTLVQFRRTTEVFDLATGRWRLLAAQLPTGRCSLAAATEADGSLLAIGGGADTVPGGAATAAVDALRL